MQIDIASMHLILVPALTLSVLLSIDTLKTCVGLDALDRKSTRLNSSHTVIYTLSLHDALPIYADRHCIHAPDPGACADTVCAAFDRYAQNLRGAGCPRSEEHTSELQSHSDLHSFPTRRSSDLCRSTLHPCT